MNMLQAAELADDAANFLTSEMILPCDEGNAIADGLATLGMNLRNEVKLRAEMLDALQFLLREYRLKRTQIFGTDAAEDSARAAIAKATT